MIRRKFDCAVIGIWHLAFVTAAGLTKLGKSVVLVNPMGVSDLGPIAELGPSPNCPVHEPGLDEQLRHASAQGLFEVSNDLQEPWQADFTWLAVDTPVDENDNPSLLGLHNILRSLSQRKNPDNSREIVVITSQVPLGFCQEVEAKYGFTVACVPENLRLGKGLETFLNADRTVVGADLSETRLKLKEMLHGLNTKFILCNLPTAEMIKHATNAFLATSISFANEVAQIGEKAGVDGEVIANALKMDSRIGPKAYVSPGLGFAGGTLPRDLRVLQKLGSSNRLDTKIVDAVLAVNQNVNQMICDSAINLLGKRRRILILGYAYKAETNTLRRSPAIDMAVRFKVHPIEVFGYDPHFAPDQLGELDGLIRNLNCLDEHSPRVDLIVVVTARDEFKKLNWKNLATNWKPTKESPITIFDTKGLLDHTVLDYGFGLKPMWKPLITREL